MVTVAPASANAVATPRPMPLDPPVTSTRAPSKSKLASPTARTVRRAMSTLDLPGPIRQNGYVVRDLEAAMAEWLALGIGPWVTLGPLEQTMTFRGQTSQVTITLAFAQSGELQLELIQQTGDAPT